MRVTSTQSKSTVNLTKISFLLAEPNDLYRGLFRSLLFGFGATKVFDALDIETADRILARQKVDALICAVDLPKGGGIAYVRKIRLNPNHPNRSMPILLTMGTARRITVGAARDSGANFVLSKPISPLVLYDRLNWIARNPRPFWESDTYFGPDRRFRALRHAHLPKRRANEAGQITTEAED